MKLSHAIVFLMGPVPISAVPFPFVSAWTHFFGTVTNDDDCGTKGGPECRDCNRRDLAAIQPGCRRLLDGTAITTEQILDGTQWQDYKDQCSDFEFELDVYVDNHIFMAAIPSEDGLGAGCAPLVFHSRLDKDGVFVKEILLLEEDAMAAVQENSVDFPPHSFDFFDMATAFDSVEANTADLKAKDIVRNNCGDFAKNFASALGVQVTPQLTIDIARRLLEHGGEGLMQKIRGDKNAEILGDKDMQDEELLTNLVESRTHHLY